MLQCDITCYFPCLHLSCGYGMAQNFDRGNIDEFEEFPAIFPIKIHLVSYLKLNYISEVPLRV